MAPAIQNFDTKIRSQTAKNTIPKTKITLLKPKLRSQKARLRSLNQDYAPKNQDYAPENLNYAPKNQDNAKNISGNWIAKLPAFYTYGWVYPVPDPQFQWGLYALLSAGPKHISN